MSNRIGLSYELAYAGKLYGNYLISAYLVVKMMYLANAIGQLFLLDAFLKINYHLYGIHVVERLIRGQDWGMHGDPRLDYRQSVAIMS